jgi:hypothetical protein
MLLPNDFYSMSPYHFSLMIKGHQEKKIDAYRQTRLLMFTMVRLHGDPKTSPKSPEALWELPGDDIEARGLNDEDIKEIFKRLA